MQIQTRDSGNCISNQFPGFLKEVSRFSLYSDEGIFLLHINHALIQKSKSRVCMEIQTRAPGKCIFNQFPGFLKGDIPVFLIFRKRDSYYTSIMHISKNLNLVVVKQIQTGAPGICISNQFPSFLKGGSRISLYSDGGFSYYT